MNVPLKPSKDLLEIRKYSNRRYYDSTRSCHLTLEEIRDLVKDGHDIRVTDNQTSADITSKVLTQVILDLDAKKLDVFPAALLAQLIRVNDQLIKGFYEKFLVQALESFLEYQHIMESQWKQGVVLPTMFPPMSAWTQAIMKPLAANPLSEDEPGPSVGPSPDANLARTLADMQRQLTELRSQMGQSSYPRPRPSRAKPKARPKR